MSTPAKSEYILLFRGTNWHKGLSPEEIQEVVKQMYAWLDRLTAQGKAKAGKPLFPEGKVVSQKKGRSVADGPFAESKEAIGGFFLLEVGSLDEAAEIEGREIGRRPLIPVVDPAEERQPEVALPSRVAAVFGPIHSKTFGGDAFGKNAPLYVLIPRQLAAG